MSIKEACYLVTWHSRVFLRRMTSLLNSMYLSLCCIELSGRRLRRFVRSRGKRNIVPLFMGYARQATKIHSVFQSKQPLTCSELERVKSCINTKY